MRGSKAQQSSVGFVAVIVVALTGCAVDPSNVETDDTQTTSDKPTGEECLAESEVSSCEALYCRWHDTLVVDAGDCTASPSEGGCFTLEGMPVGQAAEMHAYYRMQGDQLEWMLYEYDCASPFGWTECTLGAESPAGCACLCGTTTAGGDPVFCGESQLCN
jgi:hypothetical protein